jgi:hypothetical protein
METATQLSVFLENKPGRLAHLLSVLARAKINLLALTVMDHHEQGVLRFIANDPANAMQALQGAGVPHFETEVLFIELRNQPGALARVCELLAAGHVHIDYAYGSTGGRLGKTGAVFKVSNTAKARQLLGERARTTAGKRHQKRPVRDHRIYQPRR